MLLCINAESLLSLQFGLCTAFVTLVVNGQVIRVALHDYSSRYVGMFTALSSSVAAALSWAFGALDWLSHSLVVEANDSSIRGNLANQTRREYLQLVQWHTCSLLSSS